MKNKYKYKYRQILPFLLLGMLTLFICWLFVGRYGIFGSKVDWISQHSVIPDYFRQQFYETGDLFPEFAANIGGGQNIYNFSYYGLFNPVILISYLLPSVKMGDYLMAASLVSLVLSVMLLYGWLLKRGFSGKISFMVSLMYLLSGPMIFHSYCQIMFVNYMPFLCMALLGVDQYFEKGGKLLYTVSVFLMILTSFYFSIGGMLVLVLYGLHRYADVRTPAACRRCRAVFHEVFHERGSRQSGKCRLVLKNNIACYIKSEAEDLGAISMVCDAAGKETKKNLAAENIAWNVISGGTEREEGEDLQRGVTVTEFLCDGIRFLWPMLTAVLMSGILLLPTAAALTGREGTKAVISPVSLLLPNMQADRLLYTPYGIGLPVLLIVVLITGFTYKAFHERVLSWGCAVILTIPFFSWALNGGLYVRDKALIPCLPLLCYLIACYLKKLEDGQISFAAGVIPFLLTIGILCAGRESSEFSKYGNLILADAVIMTGCFLLFWRKKKLMILMVPPVVFLFLFGSVFHERADRIESSDFYEKVTDTSIGQAIGEILAEDTGFYRLEQIGSETENAAGLNRVWNMGQYISSIYSSSYNWEYQNFRKNIFGVEEPFRNDLMQSVSQNPVFLKLMGVRYLVSEKEIPGCELAGSVGDICIYKNEEAAPAAYVTDQLIPESVYDELEFPYNQMALAYGTVIQGRNEDADRGEYEDADQGGYEGADRGEYEGADRGEYEDADRGEYEDADRGKYEDADQGGYEGADRGKYEDADQGKYENVVQGGYEDADRGRYEDADQGKYGNVQEGAGAEKERQILEEVQHALSPAEIELPEQQSHSLQITKKGEGYRIQAEEKETVRIDFSGSGDVEPAEEERILFLQFRVKNNRPSQDVTVWMEGERNKLSAGNHFYYNGNTAFSFAAVLEKGKNSAELTFGKGDYEITDIRCFLGGWGKQENQERSRGLYQSEFHLDRERTEGNVIAGSVNVEKEGYFVTSIPYDTNFEILVDGKAAEYEKVNKAFVGFSIGEGSHDVKMIYHAPGRKAGICCSAAGVILFFILLIKQALVLFFHG